MNIISSKYFISNSKNIFISLPPSADGESGEAERIERLAAYLVSARKLYKIINVSFGDIFIFLNSLMLRHHFISKK